ncbi:FAD-binding oxidoreductase [Lacisediminihabitans profunda]|uniref:FAD-binding oxidoreductase n=1 Tax=Lacisediminihabitans profunda TaxID=2594790 RepID=A0A5C8UQT6_9MICO|nr:FAD-binding oxidoreductase [Lacisediminihabitans profunda]TXN30594.1 FAD-binding oxidoreductase [Lacisediminihabitans profunda]
MLDIVRAADPDYASLQHVYGATGAPAAILRPRTAEEVVQALAAAQETGGELAIRSGGHGISSISTNVGGTVIDLGRLDGITRLSDTMVRLGPGAHWGHVAQELYPWGLAISSGDSGDVGVGGLGTTGGIGLMGRSHGLTIDRLRSAQLVTADGALHRVSASEEPDLFWAVRGAGANVGIVTSFEFEAAATPVVAQATIVYQLNDAAEFLERWGDLVEHSPREISAFLYIGAGAVPFAQATVVFASDDADAARVALAPFTELPGMTGQRAQIVPYAAVPLTTDAPHTGQQRAFTHTGLADHLDRDVSRGLGQLLAEGSTQMVQIRSAGGAINDVPPDATAYAHRHQNFSVTAIAAGDSPRFAAAWEPVHALMTGMYLSFESGRDPGRIVEAFPPDTLSRLRAIKAEWDPAGVFSQNFDVTRPSSETAL